MEMERTGNALERYNASQRKEDDGNNDEDQVEQYN